MTTEPEALRAIARQAAGSLRDAENLLEQLVLSGGGGVTLTQVEDLLGIGRASNWLELTRALLTGDTPAALSAINHAAWEGTDPRQMHRQTLELLRNAMLIGWKSRERLDLPDQLMRELQELVDRTPSWRVLETVQTWGDVSLRYDAPSTLPLELAAVRIGSMAAPPPAEPWRPKGMAPPSKPTPAAAPQPAPPEPKPEESALDRGLRYNWRKTVEILRTNRIKRINIGATLRACRTEEVELRDQTLLVPFQSETMLKRLQQELLDGEIREQIQEAVLQGFGQEFTLQVYLIGQYPTPQPDNWRIHDRHRELMNITDALRWYIEHQQPWGPTDWDSYMRRSERWHQEINLKRQQEMEQAMNQASWTSALNELQLDGITIRPVTTGPELQDLGREMNNCLSTY